MVGMEKRVHRSALAIQVPLPRFLLSGHLYPFLLRTRRGNAADRGLSEGRRRRLKGNGGTLLEGAEAARMHHGHPQVGHRL